MSRTRMITRTAILTSLNIVILLLGQIIRTNTLSFLVLSSFVTAAALLYINLRYSVLLYITTSLTAFLLLPDKATVLIYVFFFGNYGIVKIFFERIRNTYMHFVLKNAYFILMFYVSYLIVGKGLIDFEALSDKYGFPAFIFVILFVMLFNIYDMIYSAVLGFLYKRMKKRGNDEKNRSDT